MAPCEGAGPARCEGYEVFGGYAVGGVRVKGVDATNPRGDALATSGRGFMCRSDGP